MPPPPFPVLLESRSLLEDARANSQPIKVCGTGNKEQNPVKHGHGKAVSEGLCHRVFICPVQHSVGLGVKGKCPTDVNT